MIVQIGTLQITLAADTATTPVQLNADYRQIEVVNTTANAVWVTVDGSVPSIPAAGVVSDSVLYVPPVVGAVTRIPLPYQEQQGVPSVGGSPIFATPVFVAAISAAAGGIVVLAGYTVRAD